MATVLVRQAAQAALEAESARSRGKGYRWGVRDCTTLTGALCAALGVPAPPAYAAYRRRPEPVAAALALRRHGDMATAHQTLLIGTGHWQAAPMDILRDGDVASVAGEVAFTAGVYRPARPEMHLTGIVADGGWWTWQPWGLEPVACASLGAVRITRPR